MLNNQANRFKNGCLAHTLDQIHNAKKSACGLWALPPTHTLFKKSLLDKILVSLFILTGLFKEKECGRCKGPSYQAN